MKNPGTAFDDGENPEIADALIKLDLDKGGIRAIAYDQHLGGYLIISRREDIKRSKFKLWLWDGEPSSAPRRITIPKNIKLKRAEGITPIRSKGRDGILIVYDNGSIIKRKGGRYQFLSYNQLTVDAGAKQHLSANK